MVKDRLNELKALQTSYENLDETNHLVYTSMDLFFHEVNEINEDIKEMESDVKEVMKINSQILIEPTSDDRLRQRLNDIMSNIRLISVKVKERLTIMKGNKLVISINFNSHYII